MGNTTATIEGRALELLERLCAHEALNGVSDPAVAEIVRAARQVLVDLSEQEDHDEDCPACGGSGGGEGYWACPACGGSGVSRRAREDRFDVDAAIDAMWDGYSYDDGHPGL